MPPVTVSEPIVPLPISVPPLTVTGPTVPSTDSVPACTENGEFGHRVIGPVEALEQSPVGSPGGRRRYSFELDGLPPGAKAEGAVLKITAVAPTDAIEVQARLD